VKLVAKMGEKRDMCLGLIKIFERKRPPERPDASWKDSVKMYFK
jgi:hypothetical protein